MGVARQGVAASSAAARPVGEPWRAGHGPQRHHGELPPGLLLVPGPPGVGLHGPGERAVAGGALQDDRERVGDEHAVLDPDARVRDQVVEPGRVSRGPTGRADDEDLLATVGEVTERDGVRCAGPRTGGGQQKQAGPLERAADASGIGAELGDDLLLEIE